MGEIKIFVCCHRPEAVPEHPLLVPIQVGAALADTHFPGFLHDDMGDHISEKNRSYCELTAQYWAWKNVQADYYGFFHYRRYLYPDIHAKQPYQLAQSPSANLLNRLNYDSFAGLIRDYDLILPKSENMHVPVRDHYAAAPFHDAGDLRLLENLIRRDTPEYAAALHAYLSGTNCYFGNIFIMKRPVFRSYCAWIFSLLAEFDRYVQKGCVSPQAQRVDGYLAERLLGIYAAAFRAGGGGKLLELPRIHFERCPKKMWKRRTLNLVLPPGTRRRALIKKARDCILTGGQA